MTKIREEKNLTKSEFAELLGITAMMEGRYESGSLAIPESIAEKIEALEKPAEKAAKKAEKPAKKNAKEAAKKAKASAEKSKKTVQAAAKKVKEARQQVILECTEQKASGVPGMSRYITTKNRKNTPDRLELKKYNPYLKKMTIHKEVK